MAGKQDNRAYALIDLYVLLYNNKYGKKPSVNKFRDRWGFTDMIESIGYDRAVEVIKFYVTTERPSHTLQWLLYNFDELDQTLKVRDEDRATRERIRLMTQKRMEEEN